MHSYIPIFFLCKRFRSICRICRQIKKNPTILPKIDGFLKVVGGIQQLIRKRSQKNN